MRPHTLWVPFSVLNRNAHSPNARLVWMLLGCDPAGKTPDTDLKAWSGLDLRTIAALRARLAEASLAPCCAKPHLSCAAVPVALLTDRKLSAGARLLYGQLQGVPDFREHEGSFTYAALSERTGISHEALRRAAIDLVDAGWLAITQVNRKRPLHFTLRNMVTAQVRARISSIRRRVRRAQYRGEVLLREFLNLCVDLREYEEDAAPDFLVNPFTGELMELDRYYRTAAVAFEHNGAQHYEETDLATFEETAKQVGRDAMKAFICKARGIELVIVQAQDLSLKSIEAKIPRRRPRRNLEGLSPLIAELEALAAEYRRRTSEEQSRKSADRNRIRMSPSITTHIPHENS